MERKKNKRTEYEHLQHLERCALCGAKLPVEIMRSDGPVTLGVFCKHCKTVTVIEIV